MKIIQIVGLGHSGTTVTDRIMACHPNVTGLGETTKVFLKRSSRAFRQAICSCQQAAGACPLWGPVLDQDLADMDEFYSAVVISAAKSGFEALADSSKDWAQFSAYRRLQKQGLVEQITLVRLVRDPRGWVHSAMRELKIGPDDYDNIRMLFYRWLVLSIKLDSRISNAKAQCFYIWYDKLILDQTESALADLIGIQSLAPGGMNLDQSTQHAITGNQFLKTDKRKTIKYDASWLGHRAIEDVYAELTVIRDYYHLVTELHLARNRRLVNLPQLDHRSLVVEAEAMNSAAPIEAALAHLDVERLRPVPANGPVKAFE